MFPPHMSRTDFDYIANVLREAKATDNVCFQFAGALALTNASFNRERFIRTAMPHLGNFAKQAAQARLGFGLGKRPEPEVAR